jgi:hypothetical protein
VLDDDAVVLGVFQRHENVMVHARASRWPSGSRWTGSFYRES